MMIASAGRRVMDGIEQHNSMLICHTVAQVDSETRHTGSGRAVTRASDALHCQWVRAPNSGPGH